MGETQNQRFQLSFHASRKVDFQGSRVTSDPSAKASGRQADGGLILVRELEEGLGFGELILPVVSCFHRSASMKGAAGSRVFSWLLFCVAERAAPLS